MNKQTIPASDEAWDEGTLGADEDFVKVACEDLTAEIDAAAFGVAVFLPAFFFA